MARPPNQQVILLIYIVLALVTFIAFSQVLRNGFINYDDNRYVTENPDIKRGITFESVVWAFASPHFFMWHPMATLSHLLDCQLFGLNPFWHHLTSLTFHIANTLLLFCILKGLTGEIWLSAFVAAVFGLHPLNVESVAWVAERKSVLSTFFWFLTIAAYLRYTRQPTIKTYVLTLVLFALGLMSKPIVVMLPFTLLLLDWWPLNRVKLTWRRLVREKIPFFALSVICGIITYLAQKSGGVVKDVELFPATARIGNAVVSYVKYIEKMFWPSGLAVFYPHPGRNLPLRDVLIAAVLLLVITVFVIRLARKHKYLLFGWFWYAVTLVPVIGLVQAGDQAMADRYAYITLVGLFIIIAWGANELLSGWPYRRIALAAASLAIIPTLSVCTWRQVGYWRNSITLFDHAVKTTGGNNIAYLNLGMAMSKEGRFDEAIANFNSALQIKPDYAEAYNNIGVIYGRLGRWQDKIEACKRAIQIDPGCAEAYNNLGVAYGQLGLLQNEIVACEQAVEINPQLAEAYDNLNIAYSRLGRLNDAIEAGKRAIKINPYFAEAYNNLGVVYSRGGFYQKAVNVYQEAIKLKPDYADVYNNLGNACGQLGRYQDAIEAYKQAIKLKPDFAQSHCGLGVSYLRLGDRDSALAEYEILKSLDARLADVLFRLINSQ